MDPTEARRLLGVTRTSTRSEVRVAYRRLMRQSHPDVATDPQAHERAAKLSRAYAVAISALQAVPVANGATSDADREAPRRTGAAPSVVPPTDSAGATVQEQTVEGTSAAGFHPVLLEACSLLGDVTGIDRSDHAVQIRIEAEGYEDSSLLVQLEERGADLIAVCSLESLGGGAAPEIADVVADLHRALHLVDG